jgi:hypothetical protein
MTAAAMQAAMKTRIGESLKMRIGKFPSTYIVIVIEIE